MSKYDYPTWNDCLLEFAAGYNEAQANKQAAREREAISLRVEALDGHTESRAITPDLRKPLRSYADFMAGRET